MPGQPYSGAPSNGATYRTVCVRLCDGFYFPVSFSTLPSHFQQDASVCQSKCAAPVELYYYQNPGATVDQSIALRTQEPYTSLKTAFRYRKELVHGCSCKEAEFVPDDAPNGGKRAETGATSATGARVRARTDGKRDQSPKLSLTDRSACGKPRRHASTYASYKRTCRTNRDTSKRSNLVYAGTAPTRTSCTDADVAALDRR